MVERKHPLLAALLSFLLPGLGQLYVGENAHGIALLCIVAGIVVNAALSRSVLALVLMLLVYLAVVIPSIVDAWRVAGGRTRAFGGESVAYVVVMLLVAGPFALPLLWRSGRFSRAAKLIWTAVVVIIALLFVITVRFLPEILRSAIQAQPR